MPQQPEQDSDDRFWQAMAAAAVAYNKDQQDHVATRVGHGVRAAWKFLDYDDPVGSAPAFVNAALPEVRSGFELSQQLSANLMHDLTALSRLRVDPGYQVTPRPLLVTPGEAVRERVRNFGHVRVEQLAAPMDEARVSSALLSGPKVVVQQLPAPADMAMDKGLTVVVGAAQKQALNGGREQVERDKESDTLCVGWQRITDGDPCAFCALLASRGPDFKSGLSWARSNSKFEARKDEPEGIAKVHDFCRCTLVPVFEGFEFTQPVADKAYQIWADVSDEGLSGKDGLAEYRRRYDAHFGDKHNKKVADVAVDEDALKAVPGVLANNESASDFVRSAGAQFGLSVAV